MAYIMYLCLSIKQDIFRPCHLERFCIFRYLGLSSASTVRLCVYTVYEIEIKSNHTIFDTIQNSVVNFVIRMH